MARSNGMQNMAKKNREPAHLDWATFKSEGDRRKWEDSLDGIDAFLRGLARFANKYVRNPDDRKTIRELTKELRDAARLGDIWAAVLYSYDLGRELADAVRDVWSGHSSLPKLKAMRENLSRGAGMSAQAKRFRAAQYAERVFEKAYPIADKNRTRGLFGIIEEAIRLTPGRKERGATTIYKLLKDRLPPREK